MKQILQTYTLLGQPYVKKNNQKVANVGGRWVKYNTPKYRLWERQAHMQIMAAGGPPTPIDTPVILLCNFFMQSRHRVDLSNLYEGVQDVLVKTGVLADDNHTIIVGHDGSRVRYDRQNPRVEIALIATKRP